MNCALRPYRPASATKVSAVRVHHVEVLRREERQLQVLDQGQVRQFSCRPMSASVRCAARQAAGVRHDAPRVTRGVTDHERQS
jgi:hypothetical protein